MNINRYVMKDIDRLFFIHNSHKYIKKLKLLQFKINKSSDISEINQYLSNYAVKFANQYVEKNWKISFSTLHNSQFEYYDSYYFILTNPHDSQFLILKLTFSTIESKKLDCNYLYCSNSEINSDIPIDEKLILDFSIDFVKKLNFQYEIKYKHINNITPKGVSYKIINVDFVFEDLLKEEHLLRLFLCINSKKEICSIEAIQCRHLDVNITVSEEKSEDNSEEKSEDKSEEKSEDESEEKLEDESEEKLEDNSEEKLEDESEEKSEEDLDKDMPDKISTDTFLEEDIPNSENQEEIDRIQFVIDKLMKEKKF